MKSFKDYLDIINESKGSRSGRQNNPSSSSGENLSYSNLKSENHRLMNLVFSSVEEAYDKLILNEKEEIKLFFGAVLDLDEKQKKEGWFEASFGNLILLLETFKNFINPNYKTNSEKTLHLLSMISSLQKNKKYEYNLYKKIMSKINLSDVKKYISDRILK